MMTKYLVCWLLFLGVDGLLVATCLGEEYADLVIVGGRIVYPRKTP